MLIVGTAGHIDHGKSALVKALTGTDPDRLKEEQRRGITIDLGFAHASIAGVDVAFVDVPGHERFVRHMLAGAGGLDAVLLVIAADESVMPQTREHFEICRLLGISRGVIVLTKADVADREMREVAAAEARDLVAGSTLADAPVVTVSAKTGEGLDDLRRVIAALAPPAGAPPRQGRSGLARMPIDRVFTMKGFGTVVTGTLVSGRIAVQDALDAVPAGGVMRVRGVQVHGRAVDVVAAPSRAALNLGGVAKDDIARGMTLAETGALTTTRRVDAVIEILRGARPLRHGARVRVHQATIELAARVAICALRANRREPWRQPKPGEAGVEVPPGGEAFVRLRLERPAALTRHDRLVLRALSPAMTIGGGGVLDPAPPAGGLRRPAALSRFEALQTAVEDASDARCVEVWLGEAGDRGLDEAAIVARAGVSPDDARGLVTQVVAAGRARRVRDRVFATAATPDMARRIQQSLGAFHRAHPDESGMPRETLREQSGPDAAAALFEAVITDLLAAGAVVAAGERLALASHRRDVSGADRDLGTRIDTVLRAAGLSPPDEEHLAASLGVPRADVDRATMRMAREKQLVRIAGIAFHPEALDRLKHDVRALANAPSTTALRIDVAMFKQRYSLSRKFAIPLLEWLDRERVTRRVGDVREVIR